MSALRPAAALVALWFVASSTAWGRAHSIASPASVARVAFADAMDGSLVLDAGATLARALTGALCAVSIGLAMGLALGLRPALYRAVGPSLDVLRSTPPALAYPLFLLSLGHGEPARLATVTFGAVALVAIPVADSLVRAPVERRDIATLAGLRGLDALWTLHLPEAAPSLATGARLAISHGLVITVVTEMLVSPARGIGVRALGALQEYRADRLWLALLSAGALGAAMSGAVATIERRARAGRDGARDESPRSSTIR
jgi:sulfonate transport system permease protein